MQTWQQNRIYSAINGTNPMVMARLSGGFAVMGDTQFLPGYAVLLPKREVTSLNDLSLSERTEFLKDMSILGDAVLQATGALRINDDILGNTDQFLHAHVFPRYVSEPPERLGKPVWLYSLDHWSAPLYQYDPKKHGRLRAEIIRYLRDHLTGNDHMPN
ncbi:HIT family protein [Lentilactobacillus hilgardii]|nr:DeoR family transcriptional regulator [Lentilactobacillus hilgardii]QEU39643.1 hypothetical protein LH500_12630 [Lentilactobacillus hilgardii]TDG85183.1 hypothetical protein C5L34_000855 [Lentilactobacillus hilgardii]